MILQTAEQRRTLLERSRTIALVGASANVNRASYFVFSYLRTRTNFTVVPINPTLHEIDGIAVLPDLATFVRLHGAPDIVDVFRRVSELETVTREAVAAEAKAIWFQYGLIDETAIALAEAAGLDVVADRCLKVEVARFNGGLSMGGMNTEILSSKRRPAPPRA